MSHPAEALFDRRPLVFTAHAAESAYLRERICAFVLERDAVPVNPWMLGGYFLYGLVDKDHVRRANNNLLMRCDELWVFGPDVGRCRRRGGVGRRRRPARALVRPRPLRRGHCRAGRRPT